MADKEKYYIGLNGQSFEVSREIYEVYYKGQRKEEKAVIQALFYQ